MNMIVNNEATEIKKLNIGDKVTCQFGNPGDSDWDERTHCNVEVLIIEIEKCEITQRTSYLVKKIGEEYVGRAGDVRDRRAATNIQGDLYCTSARTYGPKAVRWTGILTLQDAASSLGFDMYKYTQAAAVDRMINFNFAK